MSEDTAGLTNLEDDTPPPPAAEVPAPAAAPAEPAQPETDAAEVEAVEVAGKKYVPVGAVIAERKQRQALESKATRADELEAWAQSNRPYIEFLQQNPDFMKRPAAPDPVPQAQPEADPDALEAARLMDFYTPDGKPDVDKGAKWLAMQDRRAARVAQTTVQPAMQHAMQQQMQVNYQRVLSVTDPLGNKPSEQAVRAVFQQLASDENGMRSAADPRMAPIIAMWALGADRMMAKPQPAPPTKEPLITEAPGGFESGQRAPLSSTEERIIKNRGLSATKWSDLTKGFKPGQANVLED